MPKARARVTRFGAFTPQKTVDYEKAIGEAAMIAFGGLGGTWPNDARFEMQCSFYFHRRLLKRPVKGRKRTEATKADVDNLLKSVMDGLEGVLFTNDNQVDSVSAHICRDALRNRTWVRVSVIPPAEGVG